MIELLIVVLIIAILAAIAVPNFLEFQTRAKVSRAQTDMRSVSIAVEAYLVDNNVYPLDGDDLQPFNPANFDTGARLVVLTTPISYLSSLPVDVFHTEKIVFANSTLLFPGENPFTFLYNTYGSFESSFTQSPGPSNSSSPDNWSLTSLGPNRDFDSSDYLRPLFPKPLLYDPTNGTVSRGDLVRSGGTRYAEASFP